MERQIDNKPPESSSSQESSTSSKPQKKQIDIHAHRALQKQLRKVEKQMEETEQEKGDLFQWFEDNPTIYDEEKTQRYQQVTKDLEGLEEKWLEIQEELS